MPFLHVQRTCLLTSLAVAIVVIASVPAASARPPAEDANRGGFETRAAFDALMTAQGTRAIDAGNAASLAWGESYVMTGLVTMARATADSAYLDLFIEHADAVLALRDRETGATDYRGRALPGWTVGRHYSIGESRLLDASGVPTLYVRSALGAYNNETQIVVTAGDLPGTFSLTVSNDRNRINQRFANLSMDPDADNYAVDRIMSSKLAAAKSRMRLHAADLGSEASGATRNPAAADTRLEPSRYLWPVHQGMIVEPLALFARTVRADATLSQNKLYVERAAAYAAAVTEVLDVLEANWRPGRVSGDDADEQQTKPSSEGCYIVERGAPVWMDGIELPHNMTAAVGTAALHLAAATDSPHWRARATRIATTLKNDLVYVADGDLYVWKYWWTKGAAYRGWDAADDISRNTPAHRPSRQVEDISHGSIDVNFMIQCFHDGIVFTRQDMERLANTFERNVARRSADGETTLAARVDGGGPIGKYDRACAAWPLLAEFRPSIRDAFVRLRAATAWRAYAPWTLESANMNLVRSRAAQRER